jgi:hypothetical protein
MLLVLAELHELQAEKRGLEEAIESLHSQSRVMEDAHARILQKDREHRKRHDLFVHNMQMVIGAFS